MAPPNKKNIQGDIWPRLPKKHELFVFFRITNPQLFKTHLAGLVPLLTTARDAEKFRSEIYKKKAQDTLEGLVHFSAINVAFSARGLKKLGAETFTDDIFNNGMWEDMTYPMEGDDKTKHHGLDDQHDWFHQFTPRSGYIDGVFTITGETEKTLTETYDMVKQTFGIDLKGEGEGGLPKLDRPSIQLIFQQQGHVLDDDREHFGWVDGISQPAVIGLDTDEKVEEAKKGLKPIKAGTILVGGEGDEGNHPAWAKEGSFMVFRTYEQRTPEFIGWCGRNTKRMAAEGMTPLAAAELRKFSSRVVGRWPNGAPLELHPDQDPTPMLIADPIANKQMLFQKWRDQGLDPKAEYKKLEETNHTDAFTYNPEDQTKCPYAAHIRKCGPRDDFPNYEKHLMLRRGIPYGPLTLNNEKGGGVSQHDRGLLFVSYQSSITNGFRFVQKVWANKEDKPVDFTDKLGNTGPQGIDAIIGQMPPDYRHEEDVTKYEDPAPVANFPDVQKPVPTPNKHFIPIERWVIPRGGEYFFTPSISGMQDTLCK
ncbi:hypothetical protein PENANT_c006G02996 [Penicillium antarcticum]|uniref:Dyp-type peroxidase n=1 Tax=Penicillium antarcticum TaxID=416450 RepID=A0A1V6QCU2_9EURO|nr:uncharacterized protein N7508_009141 [Penicillium antarcticum]KAJ5294320.1 hypothetical protein N7508_009141 [Penicillium antarcticum]OQD87031.1 hypothetical protein PENANT_c006G02996 [Penicillium antarcticum]